MSRDAGGAAAGRILVYVEVGTKRVFACALDWPGWCRSGRDQTQAIESLTNYAPRYAAVCRTARVDFPGGLPQFEVVEKVKGSASTDFGVPGEISKRDREHPTPKELERTTSLVEAAWKVFDRVAAAAPAQLRKGPRGGGRDRDQIVEHVLGAEVIYARKLGVRHPQPAISDRAGIRSLRRAIVGGLRAASMNEPVEKGWPGRYAARRIAWHVLDHAWEMEDRSAPSSD